MSGAREQRFPIAWQQTLAELAQRVELSPWQLSRRFRERMGLGLPVYLQQLRVEEACRRLARTDDPITTIAITVGFDDPAYFSRVFKDITGRTPRAYRRGLTDD